MFVSLMATIGVVVVIIGALAGIAFLIDFVYDTIRTKKKVEAMMEYMGINVDVKDSSAPKVTELPLEEEDYE